MNRALLTSDQVAGWQLRIDQIDAQLYALSDERKGLEKKLEALRVILGEDISGRLEEDVDAEGDLDTTGATERVTWPDELTRIFNESQRPLTFSDLKDQVARGRLADDFQRSDKGFYHAISRLQERGFLRKHRGWLFRVSDFDDHMRKVQVGERDDVEEDAVSRPSQMGDEIVDFLSKRPEGATNAQIIDHLMKDGRFVGTLTKNKSGAYNVIARMMRRGDLLKEGKKVRIFKENEPPKGGSETGEVGASPNLTERDGLGDLLG